MPVNSFSRPPRGLSYVVVIALILSVAYYFLPKSELSSERVALTEIQQLYTSEQLEEVSIDGDKIEAVKVQELTPLAEIQKRFASTPTMLIQIYGQQLLATDGTQKWYFRRPAATPWTDLGLKLPDPRIQELTQAPNWSLSKIQLYGYKSTTDEWPNLGFYQKGNSVTIWNANEDEGKFWIDLLVNLIPFVVIGLLLFWVLRQASGNANNAFSFGRSNARVYDKSKGKTTFTDVAGAEEAKSDLTEIVDFLKNPKKYVKMGAKIPRGVLLMGAPGTGKTLLARAVAGEADVPFFSISGSEFVEMFVGVGASRVRDLFKKAKRNAPAIVFIDEIDAVGRQRGTGLGGGHDEREQTLNQILTEMDGFENDTSVIVIAATNRPDVLDPALLRPGRFDRRITVDLPNLKERDEILAVHARKKPLDKTVDLGRLAKRTPGFSGADLENLLNEAAILAAKDNKKSITMTMCEHALDKVYMGATKKSRILTEEERRITALHEVGHALTAHFSTHCDPVHKISILSRGRALGVTWFLPQEDKHLYSKNKFLDEIVSLLGGRAAEELIVGDITTGASNDLERASKMAREMVTTYGMSENIGQVTYGEKHGSIFLGKELMEHRNYSEETAAAIDREVKSIIEEQYARSKKLLQMHRAELEQVSQVLLDKEELSEDEFLEAVAHKEKKTPTKKITNSKQA